jgi:tetratricopeptide (TPR) repeat protein
MATWTQAEKILETALHHSTTTPDLPAQLGGLLTRHGDRLISASKRSEGIALYQRALPILRSSLRTGDASAAQFLRVVDPHIQYISLMAPDDAESLAALDEAQKVVDEAKRQYPDNTRIRQQAGALLSLRARASSSRDDHAAAAEYWIAAIDETQNAIRLTARPSHNLRESLAEQNLSLGWARLRIGEIRESLDAVSQAMNDGSPTPGKRWSALQLVAQCVSKERAAQGQPNLSETELATAV